MRVTFIKPWKEYKVGTYDLWDATEAIKSGCTNEPQAEQTTEPQSQREDQKSKAGKKAK